MVTKESLVKDREQANVAFLKLKQIYKPNNEKVYLVVEGKDDIAYYTCIFVRYMSLSKFEIIRANNRVNVIRTYEAINWDAFSPKRVFFFVDRDLSEITGESTPQAPNVYVTDQYSIENSLFNQHLFFATLRIFYGLDDLSEEEVEVLSELFNKACTAHEQAFLPIMSWILHWRINKKPCNLNNLNSGIFYRINNGVFLINDEYQDAAAITQSIHSTCGVPYVEHDISTLEQAINDHGGIHKCIRGKYVRAFFVKFLNSIVTSFPSIFPQRKMPVAIISIGQSNALQLLCGYMTTPESLDSFLLEVRT